LRYHEYLHDRYFYCGLLRCLRGISSYRWFGIAMGPLLTGNVVLSGGLFFVWACWENGANELCCSTSSSLDNSLSSPSSLCAACTTLLSNVFFQRGFDGFFCRPFLWLLGADWLVVSPLALGLAHTPCLLC